MQPAKALAPSPPTTTKAVHRNPNLLAKLAAEQSGGVNPLMSRLYSSSLPPGSGGSQPGVPNILTAASTKKPEPLLAIEENDRAKAQQSMPNKVSPMAVYKQPVFREQDLKAMLLHSTPSKNATALVPKRRQTPPARLQPLPNEESIVKVEEPPARSIVPAAPPAQGSVEATPAPLHVVSRFRTSTANTPKEFTYLQMRPRGIRDLYNPYDLQVVSHKDIDPQHYFTVSATGVTKFDEGEAEFIDLKSWEREYTIYHKLVKLNVFKQYKRWKAFQVWRKLVRRTTIQAYKTHLNDNLFHLHPDLSSPLRQIRDMCLKFQEWRVYNPTTETRTLDQFIHAHSKQLEFTKGSLDLTIKEIKEIIERACKDAMMTSAAARERELQHGANILDDGKKKSKKLTADTREAPGQQHKPSYIELSQKRAVCRRLTNYIRLCDYMVINSLVTLAMKAVHDSHGDLKYPRDEKKKPPEPAKGDSKTTAAAAAAAAVAAAKKPARQEGGPFEGMIWIVDILFSKEDEALILRPNIASFTQRIDDLIKDYVKTVSAVPRFAQMEVFKIYTEQSVMEHGGDAEVGLGPDVGDMVTSEEIYKNLTHGIRSFVTKAFQAVETYAHGFEKFRVMYLQNSRLDTNEVKAQDPALEWFREQLQMYKTQSEEIEKIPTTTDVATYCVKTDRLRDFLTPGPVQCLEAFHNLLPIIAREKNNAMLADLQACNKYLETLPTTVEEYVAYMQYFNALDNRMEAVNVGYECLKELFNLLDIEKIHIDDLDDQTYRSGTRPQFDKLRVQMQQVEDSKESQTRFFSRNIDDQLDTIRKRMAEVVSKGHNPIIEDENANIATVIKIVTDLQEETNALLKREKELTHFQETFGYEPTPINELREDVSRDINDKVRLWNSVQEWDVLVKTFSDKPFKELDPKDVNEQINKYSTTVKQVSRTQTTNPVVPKMRSKVEEWRQLYPIIQALKNNKLKEHHRKDLDEVIGHMQDANGIERNLSEIPDYTFGMLIEHDIMHLREEILLISLQATEEDKLEQMLQKVQHVWQGGGAKQPIEFAVNQHKEQKDTYVLTANSVEEVTAQLEDSLIVVSTIASSKYCDGGSGLGGMVARWETELRYMQETLDKWLEFQRNWMYLENIFSSAEIKNQWKTDAKIFEGVDRSFRDLMRRVHDLPRAYTCLLMNNSTLLAQFDRDNKLLEKVLASLERKLEEKRKAFPRFYFLSNDDLLDILSKIKQPELIAMHMLKMFDGIKTLTFSPSNDITHLNSMEGEKVELFTKTIKAGRGQVEAWLVPLEKEMFSTLRKLARIAVEDYEQRNDRAAWMFQHPAQLVLIISQIFWSRGVEKALDQPNSKELMKAQREVCYKQLGDLATLTSRKLSRVQRSTLSTLITLDVHSRDLVDEMVENSVVLSSEFGWTKLLRAYWEQDEDGQGNIFTRQNNSRFVYGYEYLGAQGRLVITPLTDRIYMTITGALKLYLGAAPAGPAGTGKTETVKDLAKNLARQCIVYNCSDGITYKMMEKFFSGLIQTGAWTCLDEFNRINIEVLSVIASQVLEIKLALQAHQKSFTFQGTPNVPIRETYGVFVTMNPGYAGRTELPDNLKILFRPVAVMTPDFRMIAEVILYSEGFKNAKDLSLKITQLYKLSSEQLSPQDHYDFGMRALKSILVMAGDLKRSQPEVEEDLTLIVACNDSNVPKFVAEDVPLFRGIMQDLFPGATFPERSYPELLPAMYHDMESKKLVKVDTWVKKGIQFYETLIVRHGVMLVGVSGTGKSESRNCIAAALSEMCKNGSAEKMARDVHQFVINPKSVALSELYGQLDVMTNEWKDGVLAVVAKTCVRASDDCNDHRWIVFDGPVDTLWIESMNSVLDDSKLLCLDNGERIKLPETIHMLFEVGDLSQASPATVSRCGMVYVDLNELPWSAVVGKWSETKLVSLGVEPQTRAYIISLFDKFMEKGLTWLRTQGVVLIQAGDQNIVQACCDLFYAMMKANNVKFMADPQGETVLPPDDPCFKERNDLVHVLFGFSFVWSVGGNVDNASQELFDAFTRDMMEIVPFPSHGQVFDFNIDFANRRFSAWSSGLKDFTYDPKQPFFDILVPTVDTIRYATLAKTLIAAGKPTLFSGQTGVGKSVIMNDCLVANKSTLNLVLIVFQFSAQTSSARTQEMVESKLKQKRKNILGAPPEKSVVLFIDDLNMPALEQYGASPPIELLRQMMGNGGFYDRKVAGFWKTVEDVTVVSACGPPEGGRNPVTGRLTRMFHLLQIPNLSEESMKRIFVSILSGFFHEKSFNNEVRDLAKNMIAGSVELFQRIRDDLRPKPSTPHYTFNLRDLAKVCQGLMQVIPRICNSATSAMRLWIHENMRCFYDRLTTAEDRHYFTETLMMDIIKRLFPGNFSYEDLFCASPIMWGDFLRFGAAAEDRVYEEVADFNKVYKLFDEYLDDYNSVVTSTKESEVQSSSMNLVFFKDHCEHLARIIRIIRQPRGSAVLVGVGGSGKRSLTRLAASIAEYKRFEIQVGKGYSMQDFHDSLLDLYNVAGIKCQPLVFLISDTQIVHAAMLEDLNNVLNCGEVPSLFSPDERDKKINQSMEAARERGITQRDEIYSFFISRVRDNLHICLCMSPVGDAFRTRCRQFPSLTNCCSIDWFNEWPREALLAVAKRLMAEIDLGPQAHLREPLTDLCVDIHSSVVQTSHDFWDELRRRYYITPTSYLEFITLFRQLYDEKGRDLQDQLARVINGRQKMKETNDTIGVMKKELESKQPLLEKASKDNEVMTADLKVRQEKASVVQISVSAQEADAAEQQKQAAELEADAKSQLDQAMPAVEAALKALDSIDKNQLSELKALQNPPSAVVKTLSAVMTMFEGKGEIEGWSGSMDWKGAREFLSYSRLLEKIKQYDKDNIKQQNIVRVQKFIQDEEFWPDICEKKGSLACRGMCIWVRAIDKYAQVSKEVAPKRAALATAQASLAETNRKLGEAQGALKTVEDELAILSQSLEEGRRRKDILENEVHICSTRLNNAQSLSESLKNEAVRWEENIRAFEARQERLPIEVFLSCACIAYFGAFTAKFRKRLAAVWIEKSVARGMAAVENFSLVNVMGDPMEILQWQICALPTDETSTENAIIVNMSAPPRRWPLLIDPQGQATKWITNKAKQERSLRVVRQTDNNYLRSIEMAIRSGSTVLLDDVGETLDPALEPLLQRQIFTSAEGGGPQIILSAQQGAIPYDPNFRLYICTKLSNPHYLPDISIKVTLVNFTVTMDGLEDQMLGEVVSIEQREVEEEKNKIIQSISDGQRNLKKMEESILDKLKNAQGNILDNEVLIQELKTAQSRAQFLSKRQEEAKEKITSLIKTRELYRPVACRCSILFFVLADLAQIDPMYQYSLEYFKKLVTGVVETTTKPAGFNPAEPLPELFEEHLSNLMSRITETSYVQVCRGLFNKDKTILSILFATSIARNRNDISEAEWQYFIRASALVANEVPPKPESCQWISDVRWGLADCMTRVVPAFKGYLEDLKARSALWKKYISTVELHLEVLPGGGATAEDAEGKDWENSLTPFQKILIIKCFREEKLLFALREYVKNAMGAQYIEAPPFNLAKALGDSSPAIPIIFILSQGSDPMNLLQEFAKTNNKNLQYLSLGQGQGENAKRLIDNGKRSGDWTLLQNCHLSKTFMPDLEAQVSLLQQPQTAVNPGFRLYLTSMPTDFFPVFVLQNSIKLTNEAPTGLRANMVRCYGELKDEEMDVFTASEVFPECSKEHAFKKLIFGLCFFHSVALERKKFGPLGWNVKYEWNDTDFHVSKQWLTLFLKEQATIPWESLEYIIGQINYGGRVTDPQDRGTLLTILRIYLNANILHEGYSFSPSGKYRAPENTTLVQYREVLQQLPSVDDPEVFGMHENANLRYQLQISQLLVGTILSIQPRLIGSKGGGLSPEEQVSQKCREFEAILPENISHEEAGPNTFITMPNGLPNSMSTVLSHELVKFNVLLSRMRNSLSEMQKALKGLTVLSEDLDKMYVSFLNDQVPQLWTAVSYASLKPLGSWFKEFIQKINFIRTWVKKGEPAVFWLPGFFNPSGFMTGALQAFARQNVVSVDKLGFSYEIIEKDPTEISSAPPSGAYVLGIFSDAWRWDNANHVMADSLPGEPYSELPVILFLPEPFHKTPKEFHKIPLYRTTIRAGVISPLGASSNYVLSIEARTDKDSDYWVLKGAACVCALDV